MSGIAGVVADDGGTLDPGLAPRLIAAAPVRGFDGTTWWQDGPACLIRHHHATTPQAVGETQPLPGPGGLAMVLDGRIDNRPELIDLLARADCRDDASDAALVLALFERFGEDCVHRLVGDWALAVWRGAERSLFLARSPMGWRPLMWSHANGLFAFSTDARTLLRGLGLSHAPNEGAIGELLALRFVTRTETLWRSVRQVEQGGAMRVERGTVRAWHWHVVADSIDEKLSDVDHIDRFTALLDQAIIAATRSNTTVSAHLSGGLDSSSVVTRAIELHRAGRIDRPVQAISARFPDQPHDETEWSSAVEEKLGITARVTGSAPYLFEDAHRWSADTYQLPVTPNFFDAGAASLDLVRQEGGRVLLTGEGGDDWMAVGVAAFPDLLRQGRLAALVREGITQYPGDPLWRRLARAAWWSVAPYVSGTRRRQLLFANIAGIEDPLPGWIDPRWAGRTGVADRIRGAMPSAVCRSFMQQQRYVNFDGPRRYVQFGNITAMADRNGVELRHPFHDLRLTRFFMSAAPRMIRRDGVRKIVLREAMRGSLPEIVRQRRDKAAFSAKIVATIRDWLRTRPVDAMLPVALGWVDRDVARDMARRVRDGGSDLGADVGRLLLPVWFVVALDIWLAEATAGWAG